MYLVMNENNNGGAVDLDALFAEVLANPGEFAAEIAAYDAETARLAARKPARGAVTGDCSKCRGTGHIPAFRHISGGDCFACDGTGHTHNAR